MKKYLLIAKITWDETLSFRLNFVMWRVRVVLQLLTVYFLWLTITSQTANVFGYSKPAILTYILGTSLISSIILSSRSYSVGDEINNGNLSNFLIRPLNYFLYHFARDIGDKAMNIAFSVTELTLLFFILRPPFFFQTDPFSLFLSFISVAIGLVLYFLFNLLLGFIGFWSPEVWAPRFIFITLLQFFAGALFPLDILPKSLFSAAQYLPFTYLLYFPLKIYLGQLSFLEILKGIFASLVWVILMYGIVKFIWNKGLKIYTAQGR